MIVSWGTINVNEYISLEDSWGKIKRICDDQGNDVSTAVPGQAVRLYGLKNKTMAGSTVLVAPSMERAKAVFEKRQQDAYDKV